MKRINGHRTSPPLGRLGRQWAVRINIDLARSPSAALLARLAKVERRIDRLRVSGGTDLAEIVGALETLAGKVSGYRSNS